MLPKWAGEAQSCRVRSRIGLRPMRDRSPYERPIGHANLTKLISFATPHAEADDAAREHGHHDLPGQWRRRSIESQRNRSVLQRSSFACLIVAGIGSPIRVREDAARHSFTIPTPAARAICCAIRARPNSGGMFPLDHRGDEFLAGPMDRSGGDVGFSAPWRSATYRRQFATP